MSIWRPERGWATVGARVVAVSGGVAVLGYGLLLGGSSDATPAEGDHPRITAVQEPEPRRSRLCRLALKAQWDIDHHGTRSTSGTADAESSRRIEKADGREDGATPDPAVRNTRGGEGGAPGADDPRRRGDGGGGHVVGGGRPDHPDRGGSDEGDRRDTSGTGDTRNDSDARGRDGRDEQSRRDDRGRGDRREDHGADHRTDDWADDWQDRRDDAEDARRRAQREAEDAREDAREDAAEGEAWQAFAVSFEDAEEDPRAGHGED